MKILLFVLIVPVAATSLCPDTVTCISRIREIAAAPRRFWFGEQAAARCHRLSHSPECSGPPHLAQYHSLGGRLFRAKTYHSAYLRNLQLFPRITYRPNPGSYRACEHEFHVEAVDSIQADPDMSPTTPFLTRSRPDVAWAGLQFDDSFVLLIVDVGYGTLNYLAVGFPKETEVLYDYNPSEHNRHGLNPLAVLVFRMPTGNVTFEDPEDFRLSHFMIQNGLEDNLIGLGLVSLEKDAFAIERRRLRAQDDLCHTLIRHKMHSQPLLARLPSDELSAWLSVSFLRPPLHGSVCCQKVSHSGATVYLDPLGSSSVSALSTQSAPSLNVQIISPQKHSYLSYHRHARTYVELSASLYSLLIVDGVSGYLHLLEVDIPQQELATENLSGITKASYEPLLALEPGSSRSFIFLLMKQTKSLHSAPRFTRQQRKSFNLEEWKQREGLRLNAVSWTDVAYDLPYAYHILSLTHQNHNKSEATVMTSKVCASFDVPSHRRCPVSFTSSSNFISGITVVLTFMLVR